MTSRSPKTASPKVQRVGLAAFKSWWRSSTKGKRFRPDFPPAKRTSFDYLGFLQEVRRYWTVNYVEVLNDIVCMSTGLGARIDRETRALVREAVRIVKGMLREDFPAMGAEWGEGAGMVAPGSKLVRAIVAWVRDLRKLALKNSRCPLVAPPVLLWGCAPERLDAAPGESAFGLWAETESTTNLPWCKPENFSLVMDGIERELPKGLIDIVSATVDAVWRIRLGTGPESWNELLADCGHEPVWVAWALHRLVFSWEGPTNDERDLPMVGSHLLQVAKGYRKWAGSYFDEPGTRTKAVSNLADVYPATIVGLHAQLLTGPDRVAELHRITSFVWFACETIAALPATSRGKKRWTQLAWIGKFCRHLERDPNATLDSIAQAIGIDPSTIRKNKRVIRVYSASARNRSQGLANNDGSFEAVDASPQEMKQLHNIKRRK